MIGDEIAVQIAAQRQRHSGDRPVVLDRDRDPGERTLIARRHSVSGSQRRVGRDVREGVDLRFELLDPAQRRLDQLTRAQLPAADQARKLDRGTLE